MYPVCFCASENYIKFAAAMIHNIFAKTQISNKNLAGGGGYIFHILCDSISVESKEKLGKLQEILNTKYPTKIQTHELSDKEFHQCKKWKGNYVANFILKFDEVLGEEAEKALCLDLDMFVFCDIRELFGLDLQGKIAAVAQSFQRLEFNSGFVLFNVQEYKRQKIQEKAIAYLQKHNPNFPDQDTLNAVIPQDKRLLLPSTYNFYPHTQNVIAGIFQGENENPLYGITRKEYESLLRDIKIAHFLDCPKPWEGKFDLSKGKIRLSLFREKWWENALQTPIFQEEFMLILKNLERRELEEFALNSISPLRDLEEIFKNTSLEYKLGSVMIKYSNRNYFYLTWILLKVALWHKIAQKIYGILSAYNPRLENLEVILEVYSDNPLILKCKKHLSYRLGVALIEAHKAWYKGGYIKLFDKIKRIQNDFTFSKEN